MECVVCSTPQLCPIVSSLISFLLTLHLALPLTRKQGSKTATPRANEIEDPNTNSTIISISHLKCMLITTPLKESIFGKLGLICSLQYDILVILFRKGKSTSHTGITMGCGITTSAVTTRLLSHPAQALLCCWRLKRCCFGYSVEAMADLTATKVLHQSKHYATLPGCTQENLS